MRTAIYVILILIACDDDSKNKFGTDGSYGWPNAVVDAGPTDAMTVDSSASAAGDTGCTEAKGKLVAVLTQCGTYVHFTTAESQAGLDRYYEACGIMYISYDPIDWSADTVVAVTDDWIQCPTRVRDVVVSKCGEVISVQTMFVPDCACDWYTSVTWLTAFPETESRPRTLQKNLTTAADCGS